MSNITKLCEYDSIQTQHTEPNEISKQINFHLKQIENVNPFDKHLFFVWLVFRESAKFSVIESDY